MRKYGVHWGLFLPGYLIAVSPIVFWGGQMLDVFWPGNPTHRDMWAAHIFLQAYMCIFWARESARQKERAAQAAENKPFTGKIAANPNDAVSAPPMPARLRKTFGIASAIVGVVTVAAYLFGGKLTVATIVAYTLGVPLCAVAGSYLMLKARQPERTDRDATVQLPSAQGQTAGEAAAKRVVPVVEEDQVPLAAGRQ